MLKVPCKVVDKPLAWYENTFETPDTNKAKWNLQNIKLRFRSSPKSNEILKYYMIMGPRFKDERTIPTFQHTIQTQVTEHGVHSGTQCLAREILQHPNQRNHSEYSAAIKTIAIDLMKKNPGGKLVILVLGERNILIYSAFKDVMDRDLGVQSVCLTEKPNLDRSRKCCKQAKEAGQYIGNVLMKLNLKSGGYNHTAGNQSRMYMVSSILEDTIVLGADVTHPGPGSLEDCLSIAAVVGSVDSDGCKLLGSMRLQHMRNDEVSGH